MTEILSTIITGTLSAIGILIPAYLLHKREVSKYKQEMNEHKLRGDVLDRILDLTLLTTIKDAVHDLFDITKADRFLILIAINGKVEFRTVSVIFEQHKKSTSSAIASYKSLRVDGDYVQMLKEAEKYDVVDIETNKLKESLLKTIYQEEGIIFSMIKHMTRVKLDNNNDCLIYCSIATHSEEIFTLAEKYKIQSHIDGTIKPSIEKMLLNK